MNNNFELITRVIMLGNGDTQLLQNKSEANQGGTAEEERELYELSNRTA